MHAYNGSERIVCILIYLERKSQILPAFLNWGAWRWASTKPGARNSFSPSAITSPSYLSRIFLALPFLSFFTPFRSTSATSQPVSDQYFCSIWKIFCKSFPLRQWSHLSQPMLYFLSPKDFFDYHRSQYFPHKFLGYHLQMALSFSAIFVLELFNKFFLSSLCFV